MTYACRQDPCASCPYRKDTPPGVWAAEEYEKLPRWDDPMALAGTFMCHHTTTTGVPTLCRGWMEVHRQNLSVRLTLMNKTDFGPDIKQMLRHTNVPLYSSGVEARDAGMAGIDDPSDEAQAVMEKLENARNVAAKKKLKNVHA